MDLPKKCRMLVSCICVCHNKPDLAHEAVQSIVDQTHPHWQALIVDSGVLFDTGYYDQFAWRHDPRIQLIRSEETPALRNARAMAPWCFNECFRKCLVRGDLIMYLCDDDILYPNAFATFASYVKRNPHAQAMYASQDMGVIWPNGSRSVVGERRATLLAGKCCAGRIVDCQVDYLQFCHKREVLQLFPHDEYWPEGKDTETHADGLFMERIGELVPIYPIDVKVSQNRRTAHSLNDPVEAISPIDCTRDAQASAHVVKRCRSLRKEAVRWRAEAECWRQQYLLNHSFRQSLFQSLLWKLFRPLRAVRRVLRPRGFDASALIPWSELEGDERGGAGAWVSTGVRPRFVVACELAAGWLRFRVHLTSDVQGWFEIIASGGNGISDAEVVLQAEVNGTLNDDRLVYLTRPALGLQINPLGMAGRFELKKLEVAPLRWRGVAASALLCKLATFRPRWMLRRSTEKAQRPTTSGKAGKARLVKKLACVEIRRAATASVDSGSLSMSDDSAEPARGHEGRKRDRPDGVQQSRRTDVNVHQLTKRTEIEYPDLCLSNEINLDWSIIIPTINDVRRVVKCISTCREHLESGSTVEFLVVDDGTRDRGTLRQLEAESVRLGFRLLRNFQNLGFSASVNHGMRFAGGRYIVLCNNDIVFRQPCLGALRQAFEAHTAAGAVGCKLIYPRGTVQHVGMDKVPGQLRWNHSFHDYPADHPAACTSRYVWSVTGALCALRRSTLQRLGGFSTAYTMAYEDLDYCLRAWTKGVRVYFCAEAVAIHEESGTLGRTDPERKRLPLVWSERERAGRRYFEKKWLALGQVESFEELCHPGPEAGARE